eukprot:6907125-Prorocentrum_lima.AAC.1
MLSWTEFDKPRKLLSTMKGDDILRACGTDHQLVIIKTQLGIFRILNFRVPTSVPFHYQG